ncbi:BREX-1 system adenine-specific DNA-methyltransferase PglX [Oceanimonas baumannii]|uniref:BREX-1 system adenine-specific DNA-methyltransferase PglX n=1 Tax=Oceanimonas baumannii TaxID=129578 RepID=UPI00224C0672|nr:BREX-1 system adenine-specific DNA-methyltransferase PglX [Oceanimonas baumannii]
MSQDNKKDMSQYFFRASAADFMKIPGGPIAYWVDDTILESFSFPPVSSVAKTRVGCQTSDNNRFLRLWHEVSHCRSKFDSVSKEEAENSEFKWFPYNKGGSYRKWFGNQEYVINWENAGQEVFSFAKSLYGSPTRTVKNGAFYFRSSVTWSKISSGIPSFRWQPAGSIFDVAGASVFLDSKVDEFALLAQLNSSIVLEQLKILSPTLNYETSQISSLPAVFNLSDKEVVCEKVERLVSNSKIDWNMYEFSWGFLNHPLLLMKDCDLKEAYNQLRKKKISLLEEQSNLERDVNCLVAKSFGVDEHYSQDSGTISLFANLAYRYDNPSAHAREQSDTLAELLSYSIGCIMGRYSLDCEGLVYAHAGNQGFTDLVNQGAYQTLPADEDGILPLTDLEWFPDDATNRFREFVSTVWGEENLQQNLDFVAESLCLYAIKPKRGESAMDTIRRYLSTQFYKDHLKTYKKRPIYWLFSSGKQKAFECLVYLHRYNEGTLARMRTEYVIPLTAKLATYVDKLEQDKDASSSAAETKRLEKEIAALHKQQVELASFDEKLRHYADMRISLDLDDGVKVNYGKFGDLLANVKDVTGEKPQ